MFLCSCRTIERRMAALSLRASDFSAITDSELDRLVERIVSMHPQSVRKQCQANCEARATKYRGKEYGILFGESILLESKCDLEGGCIEEFIMLSHQIAFGIWMVIIN